MSKERVDILLATYNGENYIKEQIDSILNQTYKNVRLIISDDCSEDNTLEILKQYADKDSRIQLHVQDKNLGVVKNIEFLLKKVESPLYMLSDQDDVWLPEKVEKSIEKLQEENADLVFGDLEVVDNNLNTLHPSFSKYRNLDKKIEKYINSYKLNYLYNSVTGCTILSKKEFIQKTLPIPQNSKHLIHDHWIALIASLNGKTAYLTTPYIKYRQHGDNQVGANKISKGLNQFDKIRELFIQVKLGVFETYVKNNQIFPEKLQEQNIKVLNYYKMLDKKQKVNFKDWNIFHELYKTENLSYYILNFIILNLPSLGRVLFKVLKLLKRR